MIFIRIILYIIDKLSFIHLFYKRKIKLANYHSIATIGERFCAKPFRKLCGQHLLIYNNGCKQNILIGDYVALECKINCNKNGNIRIGNHTSIREGTVLNCDIKIDIGNYCFIGNNVLIQDNDSHPESPAVRKKQAAESHQKPVNTYEAASSPVIIGDCVWIGTSAIILKGIKIGDGSVIGAGSLVTHDVPPMSLAVGNPARVIRKVRGNNETT